MAATRRKPAAEAGQAEVAPDVAREAKPKAAPRKRSAAASAGNEAEEAPGKAATKSARATARPTAKPTAKAATEKTTKKTTKKAEPATAEATAEPAKAEPAKAETKPVAPGAKASRKRASASPATDGAEGRTQVATQGFRSDGGPAFPDTQFAVVERILAGFVADEVRKVGLGRVVLGLSGGIDSAVSAAVAARALGPSNVLGVMMPYQSSSPESLADAREVAASLGIETEVVDITPQVDAYFARFADASRLRRGNKMARERMTILYDFSAARSALVVGTSNKTELLLGYGTLYGDMASALNPIGDLYKTQVWGLARHLGLPASVIDKPPTADLWSGQTDEVELGFSYHDVDRLLVRMIDERCRPEELVAMGFDAVFVDRVGRMVRSSQFKRRLPLIAKLSPRSIDTDFRYSRDWGL